MIDDEHIEQLRADVERLAHAIAELRALMDALRSDFDAAKAEGAEQVDSLETSIGAAREYAEMLAERLRGDVDRRLYGLANSARRWSEATP